MEMGNHGFVMKLKPTIGIKVRSGAPVQTLHLHPGYQNSQEGASETCKFYPSGQEFQEGLVRPRTAALNRVRLLHLQELERWTRGNCSQRTGPKCILPETTQLGAGRFQARCQDSLQSRPGISPVTTPALTPLLTGFEDRGFASYCQL